MNSKLYWCKLVVVSLVYLLAHQTGWAQVSPDAQKRYKAATRLVQLGDYEKAKAELNAIVQRNGPLAPYAQYYYAIATFRQKNFGQARLSIRQLIERYPNWLKINDAYYLLGAVSMETGQYEEALDALQYVTDAALRPDVAKLQQYFLSRLTDLKLLKQLNRKFPDNRFVGLALIDLIQRTASDKEDLELSDRLTNRFGIPATAAPASTSATRPTSPTMVPGRNTRPKGYFNVAVMFPFRVDEFDAGRRLRTNQYAFDLYDGIKMAKTQLQAEGITVNLFAYDVENDANKTLELVNSPAFAQTDLIIGPLYVEPNRIASAYANQNNIVLLNPIATSSELVTNQPMSFLAQPSVNTQAQKVLQQAKLASPGRRVAIYFGGSRRDSLLALAYLAEVKRQNYQVVDFRRLTGTAQAMTDALLPVSATTTGTPPVATTDPVLGHIFFASSNDEDGPHLLDALSRRRVTGPLFATASAFDFYRNSTSTFTRRELYLLYPDFIDNARDAVTAFQEEYLDKRHTIPSVFACQGYDMMLFFGRQLAKNGVPFRSRATLRTDTDDYLLSGFDYTQTNDNQIVPIVKYDGSRFVKINQ